MSSRVTRSQTQTFSNENDENVLPSKQQHFRFTKRGSGTGGGVIKATAPVAGAALSRRPRTALGDISNKVSKSNMPDDMPKKQRVVDLQATAPMHKDTAKADLDALVDDVDMNDTDELNDSIAELRLSSVDAADANNPQAAPAHIMEIMKHLKNTEAARMASANYMSKQTDINTKMREILIDWLVEVHQKFKLMPETLFLTVNIIDRFLERRAVTRTKLQLVGCTAMLIAAKYEEIYAPEVSDFVHISDKACLKDQILAMESIILNTLGFHLTVPTSNRFGERYTKVAGANSTANHLTNYFMELTMQDYKFLKYLPSEIASASVYLSMKMTTGQGWSSTLSEHTSYDIDHLRTCITDLHELATKVPAKYRAVRKKYLNIKYNEVSKMSIPEPF